MATKVNQTGQNAEQMYWWITNATTMAHIKTILEKIVDELVRMRDRMHIIYDRTK